LGVYPGSFEGSNTLTTSFDAPGDVGVEVESGPTMGAAHRDLKLLATGLVRYLMDSSIPQSSMSKQMLSLKCALFLTNSR
jgi:hypothetical protein